jgi:hypothetical protein
MAVTEAAQVAFLERDAAPAGALLPASTTTVSGR